MIDREHVLPKSKVAFRPLSYTMWNLGIACKRCNMEYKKNKTDFLVAKKDETNLQNSANYKFIHPNFDLYREHLSRLSEQTDEAVLVKYVIASASEKGRYTYDYFNLRGLEIDSFDRGQGINTPEDLSKSALDARAIAEAFGQ